MKRAITVLFLSVLAICAVVRDASAVVYFVNTASGVDDGSHGKVVSAPFKTISYALSKANATEVRIAAGTYAEILTIPSFRSIALAGAGKADTILDPGSSDTAAITVQSSAKLTLSGMTIQNARHGILSRGANIVCDNVRILNNVSHGIHVKGSSYIYVSDSSVSLNGGDGIRINSNASGDIEKCFISSNTLAGVKCQFNSTAWVYDNTISSNSTSGVKVYASSSAWIQHNRILRNAQDGIDVSSMSSVQIGGGNSINENGDGSGGRGGIGVRNSAQASINPEPSEAEDQT